MLRRERESALSLSYKPCGLPQPPVCKICLFDSGTDVMGVTDGSGWTEGLRHEMEPICGTTNVAEITGQEPGGNLLRLFCYRNGSTVIPDGILHTDGSQPCSTLIKETSPCSRWELVWRPAEWRDFGTLSPEWEVFIKPVPQGTRN